MRDQYHRRKHAGSIISFAFIVFKLRHLQGDDVACQIVRFTCGDEFSTEFVETAKLLIDQGSNFAGGDTASVGLHAVPVEGVVPTLSSVVEKSLVGS